MKNSQTFGYYSPKENEIKEFVIASPNESVNVAPKYSHGKYQYQIGKTKSPRYNLASPFQKGFALVGTNDDGIFYIDKDFTPVILDKKVRNVHDLCFLIKNNPKGVLKYVSSTKIQNIMDLENFDFLARTYGSQGKEYEKALERVTLMDNFVQENQIVFPKKANAKEEALHRVLESLFNKEENQ